MRWSELPPERLEIELAKLGITIDDLVADAQDVPELKPIMERLTSEGARRRVALEWFGDEGHPQPVERTEWYITGRTSAWSRLPRLKGDAANTAKLGGGARVTGRPLKELTIANVEKAEVRLLERRRVTPRGGRGKGKHSYEAIAAHAGLKRDRVVEIEQLMELGWSLRESHPDFSAKPGYVRLPTPREAARLLRLR